MECKRLNRMIRDWYVQVQDETLAPARMVEFMETHVETCDTCFVDPDIHGEIEKITAIVLPPSKVTKKPKKKQSPLEPTAAALAAIESGVNDVAHEDNVAIGIHANDDEIDDEIEVGDDDDDEGEGEGEIGDDKVEESVIIKDVDVVDDTVVDDVVVEDADLE